MQNIVLNQVGFLPGMQKTVIFIGECTDNDFEVVNTLNDKIVFTGMIGEAKFDTYSGETVRCGAFPPLRRKAAIISGLYPAADRTDLLSRRTFTITLSPTWFE